jgi:TPR repeat protein/serine/threonine protein kinase
MDTSTTDSQALPAGTRLEEFVIERVLGAGGFGITYLARDVSLNRQVVIKENLPTQFAWRETATGTVRPRHTSGGDADDYEWSMNNFLREAETLASLDHHGIVRVLRKFEANGTAYFVMPFVDGVALDTLIEERRSKNSPFSEQELRGLLERMLDTLAYLHDRGIYHRDIKPGNILISNEGVPALIDFGSARQRLSERSMTVIESAGYTPFEQLQSRGNVGPWSDLYALGGTLCKAITGMTPPKAADRMIGDPWVGLAANNPAHSPFSDGFLQAIDRSMAVDPSQRWQDARQWQHRLQTGTAKKSSSTQSVPHVSAWDDSDPAIEGSIDSGGIASGDTAAPALWNPTTAVNLSFLLTPAFGTFLHARNAKALGIPGGYKTGMRWFYVMCAYIALSTLLGLDGKHFLINNVAILSLWYFFSAKKQISLVKERYGRIYHQKSLITPVCTALFWGGAISILIQLLPLRALNEVRKSSSEEIEATRGDNSHSENISVDTAVTYFSSGLKYASGDGVTQNHDESVKWYRKAADLGSLEAMNNLGLCYAEGQGVPKDLEEAARWYRKAAEQGLALSQRNLAHAYVSGEGVSKNIDTATGWFKKAAMQDDAEAQYMLGLAYTGEEGIAQDLVESAKWFQKAADQGHAKAQQSIGDCYMNGKGVGKNSAKAFEWIKKSAENGCLDAQFQLGLMYASGTGGAADHGEAAKWFRKTAEGGEARGMANLGWCYETGTGVTKDEAEAAKWYRKALDAGDEQVGKRTTEALQRLGR